MYFLDFISETVTSVQEVEIDMLRCHEEVVEERLNSFIKYLQTLEGDILLSSIIVCDESNIIIDGHHRFHALKYFGIKRIPVTYIKYNSPEIKAYQDDRLLKSEVIEIVNLGKLLPPKSSKHVIWDRRKKEYRPILLLSSMWHYNLNTLK